MAAPWRDYRPKHDVRIYKPAKPGDRFRILYLDATGTERERSGGKTERDAITRAQELVGQVSSGVDGSWTVGKLLDEYIKPENHRTRRGKPWSVRYAQEQERRVRLHIRPQLDGRKLVTSLSPQDFIRVLNIAGQTLEEATVESLGQTCRAIVSYAQRLRVLTGDPMLGVHYVVPSKVAGEDAKRIDPATIPEMNAVLDLGMYAFAKARAGEAAARSGRGGSRIIDATGPLGRALQPCFVAGSGLRFGETAALRCDRLDFHELEVLVALQWVEPGGGVAPFEDLPKHGMTRTTSFAGWLAEPLFEHVTMRVKRDGPSALVFPAPAGGHLSRRNHSRWWKPVRKQAGWDPRWSWQGLRHLFAVTALAPESQGGWGMSLEDLSRLLGHHSPHFTSRRYLTVRSGASARATTAARGATV